MSATKNEASATRHCKGFDIKPTVSKVGIDMANSKATLKTVNPGARISLYPGVSCVTFDKGIGQYAMHSTNFFDVPDEEYVEGNLTGLKAAFEVLFAAKNDDFDAFHSVLEAAVKTSIATKSNPISMMDGSGAACGFLTVISEVLMMAAEKLDLGELMAYSLRSHEGVVEDSLREMKEENDAFMFAMKAASPADAIHG